MVRREAIQALRFTGGELPTALSALGTSGVATSIQALKDLAIKMYQTHRPIADRADVYHAFRNNGGTEGGRFRKSLG